MLTIIHICFVLATGATVLYSDEQGFLWMLGKRETLPIKKLELLHTLVGLGLAGLIATGGLLFLRNAPYYVSDPTFLIKMCFVFALVVNGFFIGMFTRIAATRSWKSLTNRERIPMLLSGAISFGAWAGAALCGLLL